MLKPYFDLTGRGRALRLRHLALKALEQYDLDVSRVRLITNETNGIFRVDTATGEKVILRVTLPEGGHDLDGVLGEMVWLDALSRDTDLSVPRPMAAKTGELVVQVACAGVPQPRFCAVFGWVAGTDLADHLTPNNVRKLGELSARLHAHAATFRPPAGFSILRFDKVFPFPEPVVLFQDEHRHLFPPERRAVYERAIAWAQGAIDRLQASGEPMRVIHGDLHQWNVRVYRGILSAIDFEDLMWGWPVQDIATTLYYFLGPNFQELRAAFRQGYTRHSPWPERYPGEIGAFIAARGVGLVNFLLHDPDPDWQAQVPAFVEGVEGRLRMLLESWREVEQ
jgi:Ser/Thr protein kinase RdoA (MazF antagonist)